MQMQLVPKGEVVDFVTGGAERLIVDVAHSLLDAGKEVSPILSITCYIYVSVDTAVYDPP